MVPQLTPPVRGANRCSMRVTKSPALGVGGGSKGFWARYAKVRLWPLSISVWVAFGWKAATHISHLLDVNVDRCVEQQTSIPVGWKYAIRPRTAHTEPWSTHNQLKFPITAEGAKECTEHLMDEPTAPCRPLSLSPSPYIS